MNQFLKVGFYTPIGTANVRLVEGDVRGDWKREATQYYGDKGKPLAVRFANLPAHPDKIVKFTEQYGPLGSPEDRRGEFRISIANWAANQATFRADWKLVQQYGARTMEIAKVILEFRPGQLVLRCPDLWTFLYCELVSSESRLRICARKDCPHPYFVAQNGKERYCSTACSNWAQSKWKKRWHAEQREKKQADRDRSKGREEESGTDKKK
jgi:hypothetical protein